MCGCRSGIELVLNSKVQAVSRNAVEVDTNGVKTTIPFGACVWSTGVAMHPLVKGLQVPAPLNFKPCHLEYLVDDSVWMAAHACQATVMSLQPAGEGIVSGILSVGAGDSSY